MPKRAASAPGAAELTSITAAAAAAIICLKRVVINWHIPFYVLLYFLFCLFRRGLDNEQILVQRLIAAGKTPFPGRNCHRSEKGCGWKRFSEKGRKQKGGEVGPEK
jgi:hypothetical protein